MNQLELNPGRDAGKFAYHLRMLLKNGLIDTDKVSKKYQLTTLGNTLVGFSQQVDEHILREEGKLLVRTSRLALEEFDRKKIAHALNREAGIPLDLSHKLAEETEERLLRLESPYLTAPLIREFVNALLVEKGLQEYRQKHTRLGLPVYDITHLFENSGSFVNVESIRGLTGQTVMRDYVFLNVLPPQVADAHLMGQIHVNHADSWIIKPEELQHDLRVFLQQGFRMNNRDSRIISVRPPTTLEAALTIVQAVVHSYRFEVIGEQGLSHFNVFLAPYAKGVFLEELKQKLKQFIFNLSYLSMTGPGVPAVSLGLDFTIPPYLDKVKIIGGNGSNDGYYGDYVEEALNILRVLLEIMFEDDDHRPILIPHLAINLTPDTFHNKDVEQILLRVHELAAKWGTPHFINSMVPWQNQATYLTNGNRLASDWTSDWELDTLRTGSLGTIVINLPRLAREYSRDDRKFWSALNRALQSAVTALRRKYRAIDNRLNHGLLPFSAQPIANEPYLRLPNTPFHISIAGLNEAIQMQTDTQLHEAQTAIDYGAKIVGHLALQVKKLSWKSGFRIHLSQNCNSTAAQRFAELDIKRFGETGVFVNRNNIAPYYTSSVAVPLDVDIPIEERLRIESRFHPLFSGGHLAFIELAEPERSPEALLRMSQRICQYNIGAFAFTRSYGYCPNCQRAFGGFSKKCPECKTVKNYVRYTRFTSHYSPIENWPTAMQTTSNTRIRYVI
jgi:anaerobic ribonucleoside-triphosphate reductase